MGRVVAYAVVLAAVAVICFMLGRPTPKAPPPILDTARAVIREQPAVAGRIAAARDADTLAGARAASHTQRAAVAGEASSILEHTATTFRAEANSAPTTDDRLAKLTLAYDTLTASMDSLKAQVAQKDSAIADMRAQLAAKETAFQEADTRRRRLEPLLKQLTDSLAKAYQPPKRWHIFGATCGGAGIASSFGLGCSIGPTFTP